MIWRQLECDTEVLPFLEAVPEEDEGEEMTPEEIEQLLDEFYTNLGDEE